VIEWVWENRVWFLDGIGAALFVLLAGIVIRALRRPRAARTSPTTNISNQNTVNVNVSSSATDVGGDRDKVVQQQLVDNIKSKTKVLFIDDEAFKVVNILKSAGWANTLRLSDIENIDDPRLIEAHILFIDIQGVGKKLGFRDEGLGLAQAIKNRYPEKKLIIYSVQSEGDWFHEAFRNADDQLKKNADPYEFLQCAERLAREYWQEVA
jgi:hypothetical protein